MTKTPTLVPTQTKINPTKVVDEAIKIAVDLLVPGRGMGESNWFQKNWRAVEQSAERTSREMDIRRELRNWDEQVPQFHHEMIVRYVAGVLASSLVNGFYSALVPRKSTRRESPPELVELLVNSVVGVAVSVGIRTIFEELHRHKKN